MAEEKYVEVRLSVDKRTYDSVIRLMHRIMAEYPDAHAPEHRAASLIRGAVDTQTDHGKAFS